MIGSVRAVTWQVVATVPVKADIQRFSVNDGSPFYGARPSPAVLLSAQGYAY